MMLEFEIIGEKIELFKLLKAAGLCESGGQAKEFIASGLVTVDGAPERRKRFKVRKGRVVELSGVAEVKCV
jgi:ribosome-associated protein